MGFEKVRMGVEEIFTTIVEDQNGKQLAKWKCLKRDYSEAVKILSKQFGLNIKIIDKEKKNELDWAM